MMAELSDKFHKTYTAANFSADEARTNRLGFIFDEFNLSDLDVLDIGCGPGVQFLGHTKSNRFSGIDISDAALEQASKNGYATLKTDVSTELPFPDGTFDVVVMTDILEHVAEPINLLNEAVRVLRHDGFAIISVPNHFFLSQRWAILRGRGLILHWPNHQEFEDWNYFHIRFFRSASLASMCDQANLACVKSYADRFPAPFTGIWRFPVIRHFLRVLRDKSIQQSPDLWTLHFLGVYKKRK